MSLRIECIKTNQGFANLKKDWDHLVDSRDDCPLFSSFDWMDTWWQVFKNQYKRQLYILCAYDESSLVGIAPLHIVTGHPHYFIMGKTLQFIGNGESDKDSIISQYNDLIIQEGREIEVCEAISEYLHINKQDWDIADFPFILKDALIHCCFANNHDWLYGDKRIHGYRYTIPKVNNLEDYTGLLKKRWAKMFRKKNRLLERDGDVSIKTTESKESVDAALELLARMHRERWRERTDQVIFDSERFYRFHADILKKLVPQGKAFIKTLYLDEKPLAAYYAYVDKGNVYYYQSGFFSQYANRYSPLFLLVCKEIGLASEQNQLFDFMYSVEENSYKQVQYAAQPDPMYRLLVSQSQWRVIWFRRLKKLKQLYEAIKFSGNNNQPG